MGRALFSQCRATVPKQSVAVRRFSASEGLERLCLSVGKPETWVFW